MTRKRKVPQSQSTDTCRPLVLPFAINIRLTSFDAPSHSSFVLLVHNAACFVVRVSIKSSQSLSACFNSKLISAQATRNCYLTKQRQRRLLLVKTRKAIVKWPNRICLFQQTMVREEASNCLRHLIRSPLLDDKLSTLFNTTGREKNSTGPLKQWLFEHQQHPCSFSRSSIRQIPCTFFSLSLSPRSQRN